MDVGSRVFHFVKYSGSSGYTHARQGGRLISVCRVKAVTWPGNKEHPTPRYLLSDGCEVDAGEVMLAGLNDFPHEAVYSVEGNHSHTKEMLSMNNPPMSVSVAKNGGDVPKPFTDIKLEIELDKIAMQVPLTDAQRAEIENKLADPVNHPAHYAKFKIEVIEAIEAWNLNFSRGNAVKYAVRAGKKKVDKEIEDLEKAVWYLNREIELLKAKKENRPVVKPNDMGKVEVAVASGWYGVGMSVENILTGDKVEINPAKSQVRKARK